MLAMRRTFTLTNQLTRADQTVAYIDRLPTQSGARKSSKVMDKVKLWIKHTNSDTVILESLIRWNYAAKLSWFQAFALVKGRVKIVEF